MTSHTSSKKRPWAPVALLFILFLLGPLSDLCLREEVDFARQIAIRQLSFHGATVIEHEYLNGPSAVTVSFPLGDLDREIMRDGRGAFRCGMSVRQRHPPPLDGPPMTDNDLRFLNTIPDLRRVDLTGTRVTVDAAIRLADDHPRVQVELGEFRRVPDTSH